MPDYGLKGRVAIVTGGSKGIGLAVAVELARHGADIVTCARNGAELERAASEIAALGVSCITERADVTEPADVARVVAAAVDGFGRVDILVNNATSSFQGHFLDLTDEQWLYHMNAKVMGYVRFSRAALPHMQKARWGRIVNIGGVAARVTAPLLFTNGVTNASVANLTSNLARSVASDGITVNTIHPGYVWTPRLEQIIARESEVYGISFDEAHKRRLATMPLGRFVETREVAELVSFLASNRAAAVTGQAIAIDGACHDDVTY